MPITTFFTRAALGPAWPFMLIAALFMAATTGFLLFARYRVRRHRCSPREFGFLCRLHDATELFGAVTLICGILGLCLKLFEILPALSQSLQDPGNAAAAQQLYAALHRALAPAVTALVIGGLWCETLRFFLRPYVRAACAALGQPQQEFPSPAEQTPPGPEQNFDNDWRAKDPLGMY